MSSRHPFNDSFVQGAFPEIHAEDLALRAKPFWSKLTGSLPFGDRSATVQYHDGKVVLPCARELEQLRDAARELHPWRKGPWQLGELALDCEWRSDWKWNRIAPELDLRGKDVADVGCGNGYYMFRMLEQRPASITGLEPMLRFRLQFEWLHSHCNDEVMRMLPLGIEHLDAMRESFDVVLCMGVLYHRPDPIAALQLLKNSLRPGGQLILEGITLPVGHDPDVLQPEDRYASMRNVFAIPTPSRLAHWCREAGFENVRVVSDEATSTSEQRQTEWMTFYSLQQFLQPGDATKTIEGYPAPRRTVLSAFR